MATPPIHPFIWSLVTTLVTTPLQIHSLTARSVPRQFREGLKHSKPDVTDRNIRVKQPNKLATADTHVTGHSSMVEGEEEEEEGARMRSSGSTSSTTLRTSTWFRTRMEIT